MSKKNLRRVSMLITSQSAYNLERLRAMCGYREIGEVVDKLVREKMCCGAVITGHKEADRHGESEV